MGTFEFVMDERLGIKLPDLKQPYEAYSYQEQAEIVEHWEEIRGRIPSRVIELERIIEHKLYQLGNEDNFECSCELNREIAEIASIINDLHIWYRVSADVSSIKPHL
ncbi:hypothetical protein AWM70_03970 [Paenibacillus yonginensis]|uniref:Uncharacterized protein n=1 Tax=Paenibacillus yonginensis TaxID=1462996 RepID=A0A1B1MXB8_9BACL|nr:hypothetical protein [Paenibacillus yonginensis]ANS73831.1 hypothetical protein AWM70_03970 [Paenibacillus yonginensis]